MENLSITVNKIEELQTIGDRASLDAIFEQAKKTIVAGLQVLLMRVQSDGKQTQFDEISTLVDLAVYKEQVYKYI